MKNRIKCFCRKSKAVIRVISLIITVVIVYKVVVMVDYSAVRFLAVRSGSMEPKIPVGSLVVTNRQSTYSVGQVITYHDPEEKILITHRIQDIGIDNAGIFFETKGDANNAPDQSVVRFAAVVGAVKVMIPFGGYVVRFVQQPLGFIFLIVVPGGFLIGSELMVVYQELVVLKKRGGSKESYSLEIIT